MLSLYPIAYSGISDSDLEIFLRTKSLPLYCSEPAYIEYNKSASYTHQFPESLQGDMHFTVQEDNMFYIGYGDYPWAIRVNYKDINQDYSFRHWGNSINKYLGDFSSGYTKVIDSRTKKIGDRHYLLVIKQGIPMLITYDSYTNLLYTDVQRYYLFSTPVDHVQWITNLDGTFSVLLKVGNYLYFVTIPTVKTAHPILGQPIYVPELAAITGTSYSYCTLTAYKKAEFFYHNDILCLYYSYNDAGNGKTLSYAWNAYLKRFNLSYTLPYGSAQTFYSTYNKAINVLAQDKNFIGDYKWFLVTPNSDLNSYFHFKDILPMFNIINYPGSYTGSYIMYEIQDAEFVYFMVMQYYSGYSRLTYHKYSVPTLTTALFNVNTGKPYSAIDGYIQVLGDLYEGDFKWEVSSKNSYTVYQGSPELNLTEPSQVNLRLSPTIPQQISNMLYTVRENKDYDVVSTDDRVFNVTLRYKLLANYNKLHINIKPDNFDEISMRQQQLKFDISNLLVQENIIRRGIALGLYTDGVDRLSIADGYKADREAKQLFYDTTAAKMLDYVFAPYLVLEAGGRTVRHCVNNIGKHCFLNQEEFRTYNCNYKCPSYRPNIIHMDIHKNGIDIGGIVRDEREIFPSFEENALLDVQLEA